jgi:hypothetical protein
MDHIKEFIRFVIKGLPIVAVVALSSLIAVHLLDVLPPIGIVIVFLSVLIIASAAVGIARDIIEGA